MLSSDIGMAALPVAWAAQRKTTFAAAAYAIGVIHATVFATHLLAGGWPCARDREEVTLRGTVASPADEWKPAPAGEIIGILTRTYNRARQAQITQEIAEIVGGASALQG